jgi:hypothetical protein
MKHKYSWCDVCTGNFRANGHQDITALSEQTNTSRNGKKGKENERKKYWELIKSNWRKAKKPKLCTKIKLK